MLVKRTILFCACATLIPAQPQQSPPKQPATQQKRDLRIEKIEKDGGEPPAPQTFKMPPFSYALVIGVSKYKNLPAKSQLAYADADAQLMFSKLISQEGGNFKRENVEVLLNEKATLANIRSKINDWLPSVAKEDDRVLIYFAGHGFIDEKSGKGYLAPYDIDRANIANTGLPMEELGLAIGRKIRAKSKILLTDACHSGAISPEDQESLNKTLQNLNTSLFSMTASRARERSFEGPDFGGGHGAFTWYVAEGMGGQADVSPRDGVVTADELSDYVRTQVRQETRGEQNPTSDKGDFDPGLFIAYVPANAPRGVPPAPKFGALIFVSNMDDVTITVDGKEAGVVSKSQPLRVPGLTPGTHIIEGTHLGFEPYGPKEESVYPGAEERTVNVQILIPRRRKQAAEDLLKQGLKCYLGKQGCTVGDGPDYKKALDSFAKAFQMDATYSQAAFYMARTYNSLFDEENADKYFRKAIQIEPDYLEARSAYAGMLLDRMDSDEAIRQLTTVLQRQPKNVEALTHLAQALRIKGVYSQAIETAQSAIQLAPTSGEPHLWLGDSLRLSDKDVEAEVEYEKCLKLTNFDSGRAGKLNYYVIGSLIGMGRKHRAAQHDVWSDLRSLTYFGLCDSERKLKHYDTAIAFCQKALSYSPQDVFAHYSLGLSYLHRAQDTNSINDLDPALKHFSQVVEINPDLAEAHNAAQNIKNIQTAISDYQKALRAN